MSRPPARTVIFYTVVIVGLAVGLAFIACGAHEWVEGARG